MHDQTITLFNGHEKDGVLRWYPTVFSGVTLSEIRADTVSPNAGTVGADTVEVLLPVSPDRSLTDENGTVRQYIGPKAYAALDNPAGYFTFTPQQDFFVTGDLSAEYPAPAEDEAEDDFHGFYHALNQVRDGVYQVTSAVFYSLIPHFEIGGK